MEIFSAIQLSDARAVCPEQGDLDRMTVYSAQPCGVARRFIRAGVRNLHIVDLEGAKSGTTPNFDTVCKIKATSGLFCEIGGGIRTMEVIDKYLGAGIDRVILGTAAVGNLDFVKSAVDKYGDRIAVGADLKDGYVAVKGWVEKTDLLAEDFFLQMQNVGVKTIICTDISKDGAMMGTNLELYRSLSKRFSMQIVASGGVSSMEDIERLQDMELYGAIIGKAYYTGAIDLKKAVEVTK